MSALIARTPADTSMRIYFSRADITRRYVTEPVAVEHYDQVTSETESPTVEQSME